MCEHLYFEGLSISEILKDCVRVHVYVYVCV